MAAKYDIELAETLKNRMTAPERNSRFNNSVIATVLLAKVRLGFKVEDIERDMSQFRLEYRYDYKPFSESYEQQFRVYVAIAESKSYSKEEQTHAFEKAFALVEQAGRDGVEYFLLDSRFRDLKVRYAELCVHYGKSANVTIGADEPANPAPAMSETEFQRALSTAKSSAKIEGLYRKLRHYDNHIVLTHKESWQALLDHTFRVMHDIRPFIKLLEEYSFPHMDFYTTNSRYIHFGLAAALSNPGMRQEAIKHLSKHTGHGGFSNMMKVYEVMGDKRMGKMVFERYLQLCHFLVE